MILIPEGWIAESAVGSLACVNPERTMQVRYRMRLAPLRTVQALVTEALAELPEWRTHATAPRERPTARRRTFVIPSARWRGTTPS